MSKISKKDRHEKLISTVKDDPFLTDEELSIKFNVSIQTIRLDRIALNISEVRERVKDVAKVNYKKVKTLTKTEIIGELIDIELNHSGISYLLTDDSMVFERSQIVKGYYIFSMAESLALAVIDEPVAIAGVANLKYHIPVRSGEKLIAKAKVVKIENSDYYVHVTINVRNDQVFRSKFLLRAVV
jgi:acyl-coenzyme A thioesterase PaaI-like protein